MSSYAAMLIGTLAINREGIVFFLHLLSLQPLVNPRRACAARVTVLGLSVSLRLFSHYRLGGGL